MAKSKVAGGFTASLEQTRALHILFIEKHHASGVYSEKGIDRNTDWFDSYCLFKRAIDLDAG